MASVSGAQLALVYMSPPATVQIGLLFLLNHLTFFHVSYFPATVIAYLRTIMSPMWIGFFPDPVKARLVTSPYPLLTNTILAAVRNRLVTSLYPLIDSCLTAVTAVLVTTLHLRLLPSGNNSQTDTNAVMTMYWPLFRCVVFLQLLLALWRMPPPHKPVLRVQGSS